MGVTGADPQQPGPQFDELEKRARARVGSSVAGGRWQLDSLLGVGGMAAVYAATHRNGKRVALKILHAELSTNPDARERFLEEAYTANRVGHPNVVSILDDSVTEDGCSFLVMELLEGHTLDARVLNDQVGLKLGEVLRLADQILDVLAAAHVHGIVHRDIKPENVFLCRDGSAKLLDFGIARAPEARRTLRTQIGSTMGTPAFMAPEQARGRWEQIDGRTDLWSLGATLFFALTGRLVHQGETLNEELLQAMTKRAPALRTLRPELPEPVATIVDRALAFEKEQRWPDARAMQAELKAVAAALDETQTALPVGAFGVAPSSRGVRAATSGNKSPTTYRPVSMSGPPQVKAPKKTARAVLIGASAGALLVLVTAALSGLPKPDDAPAAAAPVAANAAGRSEPRQPVSEAPSVPTLPVLAPSERDAGAEADQAKLEPGGPDDEAKLEPDRRKRVASAKPLGRPPARSAFLDAGAPTSAAPTPPAQSEPPAAPQHDEDPLSRRK